MQIHQCKHKELRNVPWNIKYEQSHSQQKKPPCFHINYSHVVWSKKQMAMCIWLPRIVRIAFPVDPIGIGAQYNCRQRFGGLGNPGSTIVPRDLTVQLLSYKRTNRLVLRKEKINTEPCFCRIKLQLVTRIGQWPVFGSRWRSLITVGCGKKPCTVQSVADNYLQ